MTHSNLSIRQINEYLRAGKPCYLQTPERNVRIFRARTHKGQFQIMPMPSDKWQDADIKRVICAY